MWYVCKDIRFLNHVFSDTDAFVGPIIALIEIRRETFTTSIDRFNQNSSESSWSDLALPRFTLAR